MKAMHQLGMLHRAGVVLAGLLLMAVESCNWMTT